MNVRRHDVIEAGVMQGPTGAIVGGVICNRTALLVSFGRSSIAGIVAGAVAGWTLCLLSFLCSPSWRFVEPHGRARRRCSSEADMDLMKTIGIEAFAPPDRVSCWSG